MEHLFRCEALAVMWLLSVSLSFSAVCRNGTFGANCAGKCHCNTKLGFNQGCNPYTSKCFEGHCERGYIGTYCEINSFLWEKMFLKEDRRVAVVVIDRREGRKFVFTCTLTTIKWKISGEHAIAIEKWQGTGFKKINNKKEMETPYLQSGRFSIVEYDVEFSKSRFAYLGTVKMAISALKVEDSGVYRCAMVKNVATVLLNSSTVTLNVLRQGEGGVIQYPEFEHVRSPFHCNCKKNRGCVEPYGYCPDGCISAYDLRPPECQAEFPKLKDVPVLIERTETAVKFKFRHWNWNTDIGDGPPNSYIVLLRDLSTTGSTWKHMKNISHKRLTEREATGPLEIVTLSVSKEKKYEVGVATETEYSIDRSKKLKKISDPKKTLKLAANYGEWGIWQQWESCRKDLTTHGLEMRKRHCGDQKPSSEGDLCEGNMDEYRKCSPSKGMATVKKRIQGPTPTLRMTHREAVAIQFIHPAIRSDELTPDVYEVEYREVGRQQPHLVDKGQLVTLKHENTETVAYIPVKPGKVYEVTVFAAYHFGGTKLQRIAGKASETLTIKGGKGCTPGFFGMGCSYKCHCKGDEPCSEVNGKCPGECDTYYTIGNYGACTSHKGCPVGWWGEKCRNKCNCENDANCDNTEFGDCAKCKKRFIGIGCSTKTPCKEPKVYGPDCNTPCNCLNDAPCDDYTGKCDRCPPGFSGENCSIKTRCMETFEFYPTSPAYPYKTFYCEDAPTVEVSYNLRGLSQNVIHELRKFLGVVESQISSFTTGPGKEQRFTLVLKPPEKDSGKLTSSIFAKLKDLIENGNTTFEHSPGDEVKAKPGEMHLKPALEEMDKAKMIRILAKIDKQTLTEDEVTAAVHDFFERIKPTFSQDRTRYKNPFISPKGYLVVDLLPPVTKVTTFSSTILRRLQKSFNTDTGLKDRKSETICTILGGTVTYDLGPEVIPDGNIPNVKVYFFVKSKKDFSVQTKAYEYIHNTLTGVMGVSKERIVNPKATIVGKLTLIEFVLLKPTTSSSKPSREALRAWNTQVYSGKLKVADGNGNDVCDVIKQTPIVEHLPAVTAVTDTTKVEVSFTANCTLHKSGSDAAIESLSRILGVAQSRLDVVPVIFKAGALKISITVSPPTMTSTRKSSEALRDLKILLFYGDLTIKDGDAKICTTTPLQKTSLNPVGPDPSGVKEGNDNKVVVTTDCDSTTFDNKEQLATDALAEVLHVQTGRIVSLKVQQSGSKCMLKFTLRPPTTSSPIPSVEALKWLQEVVKARGLTIKKKNGDTAIIATNLTINAPECRSGFWGENCEHHCNCENGAPCENSRTGDCPRGKCKKRFTGPGCATVVKCSKPMVYGPDCNKPCNCLNNIQCDDYSGKCDKCPSGFSGEDCSINTTCKETFDFYPPSTAYRFSTFFCVDVPFLEVSFELADRVDDDVDVNTKVLRQLEKTLHVANSRISSLVIVRDEGGHRVKFQLRPPAQILERTNSEVIATLNDIVKGGKVAFEHPVGNQIKAKTNRLHVKPVLEELDKVNMVRILVDINKKTVLEKDLTAAVEDFFLHINPTFSQDSTRYKNAFVSPRGRMVIELGPPAENSTTLISTIIKRLQQAFHEDNDIKDGKGNSVFVIKGGTVRYDLGPKDVPPAIDLADKVSVSFFVNVSSEPNVSNYIAKTVHRVLEVSKQRIVDVTSTVQGEHVLVTFSLLKPTELSTKLTSQALRDWNKKVYEGSVAIIDDQGKTVCTVLKQESTAEPTTTVPEFIDKLSKVKASFRLKCTEIGTQILEDRVKESLSRVLDIAKTRLEKVEILNKTNGYHVSVVILPPAKLPAKRSSIILKSLYKMLFKGELKISDSDAEVCTKHPQNPTYSLEPVVPEPPGLNEGKDKKVVLTLDCASTELESKEQLATDALVETMQVHRERITNLTINRSVSKPVMEFILRPPTNTSLVPSRVALKWLQAASNDEAFIIKTKEGKIMYKGTKFEVNPKTKCGWYGPGCGNTCDCDPGQTCNQLGQCEPKITCPNKTFGEQCKYQCDCGDPTTVCPPEILSCESNCTSAIKKPCKVVCAAGRYGEDCSEWCNCSMTIDCVDGHCKTDNICENPKKYGKNCELDCQCAEGDTCSRAEGFCKTCEPLRYGEKCEHECGCLNSSLCTTSSGSCQGTCLKGRWGLNCENECVCENCNSITGKCNGICPRGRFGVRCSNECYCKDNNPCTLSTGCHGCSVGHKGYYCNQVCLCGDLRTCSQYDRCPRCVIGWYGITCEHDCQGCVFNDCNRFTGACMRGCKPEWWGAGCKNKCACRLPGTCNPIDGHCTSGCVEGRTGPACSNLCQCEKNEYCVDNTCDFRCPKYHFGHDCRNISHCSPGDTYDLHTGRCSSGICEDGYFGIACSFRCHCKENRCKPTGECLQDGCAEGWYGPSCSHRCNCIDLTKCDSGTGACEKCPVGWYGFDCSKPCFCRKGVACNRHTGFCPSGCPPFRYGVACDRLCDCYDGDICERFSGTCCKPSESSDVCFREPTCNNTFGPKCEKQSNCQGNFNRLSGECSTCKTGYYGFACENKCHCKGNTTCSGDGNRCASGCDVGWFGFYCEKPCHCYKKAPCEKGKCNMGCEAGWWGYSCDRPCNCESPTCSQYTGYCDGECIPGKYGYSCEQSCFCPDVGRCMRKTGNCAGGVCPANRFGHGCQNQCHCLAGSECIKGVCKNGCDKGWSGPYCQRKCNCLNGMCNSDKCEKCLPGTFGARCEKICHCAGKCNEKTNECEECPPGRWGHDCQQECHCNLATSCDRLSGKCPSDCQYGFFGYACNQKCRCMNWGKCDQFTGECLNGVCELGYYGLGCQSKCACGRACDQITGQCNDVCLFTRYGDTCKEESNCAGPFDPLTGNCTTVCRPGWYGYNCAQKCNCDEETVGYCHPLTGECSNGCPPTYYGHNCKSRCYCVDNNGRCPRDTGQCSNCTAGWFGPRCDKRCHCQKRESCPGGTCPGACEQGWMGQDCSEPTPCSQPNRYGKECTMVCHCLENKPCHRFTGKCNKCKPRWKGDTCSHFEDCDKPNVYGEKCESECRCLSPDHCDNVTGSCGGICPPRRQGDKCDLTTGCTLPGTFGEKCEHKCHCKEPTCDDETGSCKDHGGCAEYFSGDNCSTFKVPESVESDIGLNGQSLGLKSEDAKKENVITITVGGVCALVVICCIALAVFVFVAKTHKSRLNLELEDDDDEIEPEVKYIDKLKRPLQSLHSSMTGSDVENTSLSSVEETTDTHRETSTESASKESDKEEES